MTGPARRGALTSRGFAAAARGAGRSPAGPRWLSALISAGSAVALVSAGSAAVLVVEPGNASAAPAADESDDDQVETRAGAAGPQRAALEDPEVGVRVVGNRALPEAVYHELVTRAGGDATPAGARRACDRLAAFLAAADYSHAHVRCAVREGELVVAVDEGTIARVSFPGQSGLTAVAANVVFRLEDRVFNRRQFQRSVARVERALGVKVLGYELVQTATIASVPFQLSEVDGLLEATGMREGGRYVLLIHLQETFMSPGFGFGLGATGPDGLIAELRYRWADVFRPDDRLKVGTEVGLRVTDVLDSSGAPLVSRAGLTLIRYSPEVFTPGLRWFVGAHGTYLNRRRLDLNSASYDLAEPRGGVGLAWRKGEFRHARVGVGMDYRALLDSDLTSAGARPRTTGFARAFIDVEGSWAFLQPKSLRLDHSLVVGGYARAYATERPYANLRLTVEKGFPVGRYNELRLEGRGVALIGGFGVVDEYRVSDLFRGLYGDRLYTSQAATASSEFFLSLERERLRASVFVDGLVYQPSDFASDATRPRPGLAGGLGLHALFFDAYQGSIYALIGVADGRSLDGGFNLSLARIF